MFTSKAFWVQCRKVRPTQLYNSIFCCESHKLKRLADQNEWFWWDSKRSVSLSNHKTDTHKQVSDLWANQDPIYMHVHACTSMDQFLWEVHFVTQASRWWLFISQHVTDQLEFLPTQAYHTSLLVLIGCSKSLTRSLYFFKFQIHNPLFLAWWCSVPVYVCTTWTTMDLGTYQMVGRMGWRRACQFQHKW